jgi:hypothetical protein
MSKNFNFRKLLSILRSKLLPATILIIASSYCLYYIYKGWSKVRLTKWLNEYITKVNEMIKEESKELSIETISYILHLNTELADFFYSNEYYEAENNRMQAYEDDKNGLYDLYMIESIDGHDKCLKKAKLLLKDILKININKLENRISSEMSHQTIYKLKVYRKQYNTVPHIDRDKLIECYLYYSENKKRNFYLDQKEMNLMKKNKRYEQTASFNIFRNKYKLQDYLLHNYNIHYKYLDQLLKQFNLLKIPKINYFYDELSVLQDYV